jgi:DNA invertase Pin-like site-specific DNA recombinase
MTLRDSGVEFVAADLPEANTMTVGVMAVVAQHEREAISLRTVEALAAARARGTKLGGRRNGAADIAEYQGAGVEANQARADAIAAERRETIEAMQRDGLSLNAMAARLNAEGVVTSRGKAGAWTATAVRRMVARLERVPA